MALGIFSKDSMNKPSSTKSVITTTSVGSGTTGVQQPKRLSGVTKLPRQAAKNPKK